VSTEYGPSPAERARTVLACAAVPTIDIAGRVAEDVAVHATNAEGALVLLAPTAGVLGERAACGPAVATLHATRLLPLPVPDRVLARVTIHGTLELVGNPAAAVELLGRSAAPDQTVLRLDPHQVRLDGEPVDPEAYRLAAPDPIAPRSDALVTHLVRRHTDQVMALAELLDRRLVDAAWMIAPACIDRFGLTFHLAGPAGVAYPRSTSRWAFGTRTSCPPPCAPSTAARASPTAASATPDPTPASPRISTMRVLVSDDRTCRAGRYVIARAGPAGRPRRRGRR